MSAAVFGEETYVEATAQVSGRCEAAGPSPPWLSVTCDVEHDLPARMPAFQDPVCL